MSHDHCKLYNSGKVRISLIQLPLGAESTVNPGEFLAESVLAHQHIGIISSRPLADETTLTSSLIFGSTGHFLYRHYYDQVAGKKELDANSAYRAAVLIKKTGAPVQRSRLRSCQ
jgi:hypothetical protein